MSQANRTGDVIPLRAASPFAALIPDGDLSAAVAKLDAVDWSTRDAEVAALRLRDQLALESERTESRVKALLAAGFPARAVSAARAARETKAVARMRSWKPSGGCNAIVLLGAAGAGKTVAATWWALQRDHAPAFVRASSFAAASRYDREERAGWMRAGALVLDDLGAEYVDAKGSFLTDLDELVDLYYGDGRPLVITTNIPTRPEFEARYQNRIADRLRECAVFFGSTDKSQRGGAK